MTSYTTLVKDRAAELEIDLQTVAPRLGTQEETWRRLLEGTVLPSKYLSDKIADLLQLNPENLWRVCEDERALLKEREE